MTRKTAENQESLSLSSDLPLLQNEDRVGCLGCALGRTLKRTLKNRAAGRWHWPCWPPAAVRLHEVLLSFLPLFPSVLVSDMAPTPRVTHSQHTGTPVWLVDSVEVDCQSFRTHTHLRIFPQTFPCSTLNSLYRSNAKLSEPAAQQANRQSLSDAIHPPFVPICLHLSPSVLDSTDFGNMLRAWLAAEFPNFPSDKGSQQREVSAEQGSPAATFFLVPPLLAREKGAPPQRQDQHAVPFITHQKLALWTPRHVGKYHTIPYHTYTTHRPLAQGRCGGEVTRKRGAGQWSVQGSPMPPGLPALEPYYHPYPS